MGRSKGDGARSKSRPSSSSLAASLLPQGAPAVGFGGFVGSSRVEPSLPTEEAPFTEIDSELAQHLKRLARKDPTTKLKALASLSQLFKQKTLKAIVPIIPQWAFEFKKLLRDYNREVRRATHATMTNLFNVVGRELAPHLKSMMGPWWLSQFDSAAEVSQAAKSSFQAAFPTEDKRLDALILCLSEIFMYIEENLELNPQSISGKMTALDELGEMHQQVIISSLFALATLLDVLVDMQYERPASEAALRRVSKARDMSISLAVKLFSTQKSFLEFLKSRSPAIRSAVYSVIRSFITNVPSVIEEANVKNLAPVILGAFKENEPSCHSLMWEMILMFSKRFPESWMNLNVQKTVLNHFWQFLKSGCFGSQQASYPALILFLDVVPPKAVVGQKFLLEFFQNLWAGRCFCNSTVDRQALFRAIRECFLWVFRNSSRYFDGAEAINSFHCSLTDQILIKLLWHDYLHSENSKDNNDSSSDASFRPGQLGLNGNSSAGYFQDLGNCIIEILSGINSLEHNMLMLFCAAFQETCLGIFQLPESSIKCVEQVKRVTEFLLLLDQQVVQKSETWPFSDLVGPTLVKCFPLIKEKEHDSQYSVRFMVAIVHIFGPHKIVEELSGSKLGEEDFLHAFSETFIPWCLQDHSSTMTRLDLLLALLDDRCFSEQWDIIIFHATNLEYLKNTVKNSDSDSISVLAMLLEKATERIQSIGHLQGSCAASWQHKLLDSTAIAVVREFPSFGAGSARFVRAALGGMVGDGGASFLSMDVTVIVFKEVLRKLTIFMNGSSFAWVRDTYSLITIERAESDMGCKSSIDVHDMAHFACQVLDGVFLRLKHLTDEVWLISGILSAVFVIDWECSMATVFLDEFAEDIKQNIEKRLLSCKSVNALRNKIDRKFLKSLGASTQKNLESILVNSVRSAVTKEDNSDHGKITSMCCNWIDELLCLCQEESEEQMLFDNLLSQSDSWPQWVLPNFNIRERTTCLDKAEFSEALKFVSFIGKLISKLGFQRFFGGAAPSRSTEIADIELTTSLSHYSRAWLVAEILCTWSWPGGSALSSFLPSLIVYVKSESYCHEAGLLDSLVTILVDGALVHGGSCGLNLSTIGPVTLDEVDMIREPFLRALVSLLLTLFYENIWDKEKALFYFKLILTKLNFGETINANCLRIVPPIVDVLIRPLSIVFDTVDERMLSDSSQSSEMQEVMMVWLKQTLSFPPLNVWLTGEGMEDWFHLVMACYPIRGVEGEKSFCTERYVSSEEKMLLIELFRKQRLKKDAAPSSVNKLPVVDILLSKIILVSIAYCWKDFAEEDWEFVIYHLRRWIELAVVTMEEVAENVNDAITHSSTPIDLQITLRMLEDTVSVKDPFTFKLARNALVGFSLFSEIIELQKKDGTENSSPLMDKWEIVLDRILEGILRLFFSTAAAEAISSSYCSEASSIIASSRFHQSKFWGLVASNVVKSSSRAREKAVKSVEIWGLSKGPISSLFALLFSHKPLPSLQFAAYVVLSAEPVSYLAFVTENNGSFMNGDISNNQDYRSLEPIDEESSVHLREEISSMLEKYPSQVLEMDLLSAEHINILLAWSLLLSHLVSLPSSSPSREKIVQYIQDSSSSSILDCLFMHIPLEFCAPSVVKKKDLELPASISEAARAATRVITCGSAVFALESLWPVQPEKVACLAGATFGLMLQTLPAYVRAWFSDIRNRSTSSAVEFFTKSYCSPPLIAMELSQIKKEKYVDNFSVSVSKSANEIVATYTKDETGMDLVIRLPASYPLRCVDVDCTRSLGISEVKKRKWLMSMMSFVRNQNGALAEAIRIWKSNFDKEFEGVEECPICYSVIHTSNHSLPRLACKTCKHKFHSACLYKWFSTSHKSTCPLCQSPF
ncbi:unnamed protein product [Cuscuta campestris]|uniref:E3 ubiquitin-protein ligase listerin n=1 Tax=Cuscuta campestris TaxID=132261 RepID=A0A484L622_9ASTE|nr:unnamed protein product [Cuscuta campestris]